MATSYVYDKVTGKWTKVTTTTKTKPSPKKTTTKKTTTTTKTDTPKTTKDTKKTKTNGNLTDKHTDPKTSKGKVEKAKNYIELNTLEGTLNFIPTPETIRLKAGNTVKLSGLGKNLSGNYYVKSVTRSFSSSGFSLSAVVIKTDIGTSLKLKSKGKSVSRKTLKVNNTKDKNVRTYTVRKGDTLKKIALKFYKNCSTKSINKIYNANKRLIKADKKVKVGQKLIIP